MASKRQICVEGRADRRRRAGRRADDDQDRDRQPRRRRWSRSARSPTPARTWCASPCRATKDVEALKTIVAESPIPVIADIHFNHTLALKAIDAGAHCIRLNPGNIGGREKVAEVAEKATAAGVPMRIGVNSGLAAQAPARARAGQRRSRRWSGRRGRVRRADGGPRLRELQGLDQVDQRAQHDRRQPPARREDPLPAPPRHHRGGHQVVGLAEVGGRPRHAARRRHRRHDPDQPLDLPRRGGGQGRLGDPQGAAAARARPGADRLPDLRPAAVRHGHGRRRDRAAAGAATRSRSRWRCSAAP